MKIIILASSAFSALASSVAERRPGDCYWAVGHSGDEVECLPDFYIAGACESAGREECRVSGFEGFAMGIHCCPSDKDHHFEDREDCAWGDAESGEDISCPEGKAAFGRCATSNKNSSYGECKAEAEGYTVSHKAWCCNASTKINDEKCGWIYAGHGSRTDCPNKMVVAGFCGVNNAADCHNDNFSGIRCCPSQSGPQ